jgi:hypothetical protein
VTKATRQQWVFTPGSQQLVRTLIGCVNATCDLDETAQAVVGRSASDGG